MYFVLSLQQPFQPRSHECRYLMYDTDIPLQSHDYVVTKYYRQQQKRSRGPAHMS